MSFQSAFAHEVFHRRRSLALTQQQVADAVCISLRWYQQIEKGAFRPSFPVGLRLMGVLGIDPGVLLQSACVPIPDFRR